MGKVQKLEGGTWQEAVSWVLGGENKGKKWMKEIEEEREIRRGGRRWGEERERMEKRER